MMNCRLLWQKLIVRILILSHFNLLIQNIRPIRHESLSSFSEIRLKRIPSRKMKFRRVLLPLIRLCQCSGLSPISVYRSNATSPFVKKIGFAILSAVILFSQLLMCVHFFAHSHFYIDWSGSSVLASIQLFTAFTIRLHAVVVLIESYVKRSIQLKMLVKLDEIEIIFVQKLKFETNDVLIRERCRRFIISWMVKFFVPVTVIFFQGIVELKWNVLYIWMMTLAPIHTCTLFYAQWIVYLDMIKYNIESINVCLTKLEESTRIYWLHGHQQPISTAGTKEICRQLIHLRKCYCKTWEASVLVNRCFLWSLLFGVTNDFVLYVTNLYWILHVLVSVPMDKWSSLVIFSLWIGINMSHIILISRLCDQISKEVSAKQLLNSKNECVNLGIFRFSRSECFFYFTKILSM